MFAVESYAAVWRFVFVEGHSRHEAARVFGLSRDTVAKMCRFSLPPGYSVPTAYGFQDVVVKGFVDEVVILCGGNEIARHPRCYGEGAFIADPLHYLALIETKPNALDQAAALQGWNLPEVFQHLRHLLEARMGNQGKREFIQVLRLLEALPLDIVTAAVTQAIHIGAPGFDAIKLIALARIERRPARLDLAAYPHLPKMDVKTTSAADYAVLAA